MTSSFLNLNLKDLTKGLGLAIITSIMTYLYQVVQAGSFNTLNLKQIGVTVSLAVISYLIKNFTSNSDGTPLTAENKVAS